MEEERDEGKLVERKVRCKQVGDHSLNPGLSNMQCSHTLRHPPY